MNRSRVAGTTLAALLLVGATAAGCGSKDPVASPASSGGAAASSSPSASGPSAKDALLASVKTFDTTSYHFQIRQTGVSGQGKVDPTAKAASISVTGKASGQSIAIAYLLVGGEVFVKLDLGAALNQQLGINKAKWMKVDTAKVTDKTKLPLDANGAISLGTADMLSGVAGLQHTDATHFTGTVDVTNADSLLSPDKDVLTKVGDKAKTVPFTATVDDKGRLTALKVDGSTIDPGLSMDVSFDGFGATQAITKPAGAIPAPASLYSSLFAA